MSTPTTFAGGTEGQRFDAAAGSALDALERWLFGKKSRAVSIDHDDGYGSSCWTVKLHGKKGSPEWVTVTAYEGCDADRDDGVQCADPNEVRAYPPPESNEVWAGLARTIQAAIDRADEVGL